MDLFAKSTVSLSLEGTTLRLLYCQGRSVKRWASIPFNPRLLRGGHVSDPAGLGQTIDGTLDRLRLPRKGMVCAVSGIQGVSRVLGLPKKASNLGKIVEREARRVMSVSADSSYLFWQPIKDRDRRTLQRVFVLGMPKEPLDAFLEALRTARIRPSSVDIRPLALARAANVKDAVIANLEDISIDVVVVVEDIPLMMRSLHLGETPPAPEVAMARLMDELSRTIRFHNDTNRDNPLPADIPVILTGERSTDPRLPESVQAAVGHPVSPPEPPLKYPPGFPVAEFMMNLGLTLKVL
ncbi:MAG: hypothetical protein HYX88_02565 [Chloroflexi bacterium]|nr:hypothetical protein [Chloroflexota bacterium]